jgi:hypothetical protein
MTTTDEIPTQKKGKWSDLVNALLHYTLNEWLGGAGAGAAHSALVGGYYVEIFNIVSSGRNREATTREIAQLRLRFNAGLEAPNASSRN